MESRTPSAASTRPTDGGETWKLIKFVSDKAGFVDVAARPARSRTSSMPRPGSACARRTRSRAAARARGSGSRPTAAPRGPRSRAAASRRHQGTHRPRDRAQQSRDRVRDGRSGGDRSRVRWLHAGAIAGGERPLSLDRRRQDVDEDEQRRHAPVLLLAGARRPARIPTASTSRRRSSSSRTTAARRACNAAQGVHVDDHGLWIDPNDPEHWVIGNDGGVAITFDRGGNFWYPMNIADRPVLRGQLRLRGAVQHLRRRAGQRRLVRAEPAPQAGRRSATPTGSRSRGGDGFYTAQDPTEPEHRLRRVAGRQHSARRT